MKNLLLIAVFVTGLFTATAQTTSKEGATITVTVDKLKNNNGQVLFALYTESTFMKTDPVKATASKIEGNKVKVTFTDVPKGEYAIICIHDENNNGQMDFDESRMPLEDYGTSNNPMSYGPPQFDPAKFAVGKEDVTLQIIL
ncbi:hypothetical protein KORDIASMS9_02715 [Kordia sp. SMS9]|uniref:DUF2141 domain-containing protein n=1 Tax=Kordia sp. SMS9 TaxID=2282170 RepID=UPI000E0CE53B|nr:DUF2141 domain-containing protein [Kordia sp. SMS9]AXG70475.1 hypothetical protein KORDIASMS9_02715 [Kordia sp. SMS9]